MFLLFLCFVWFFDWVLFDCLIAYSLRLICFNNLSLGLQPVDSGIDSAASSVIKKANILTLTKETADGSSKNLVTKLVAGNKVDREPHETTGERAWQKMDILEMPELIITSTK